MANNFTGQKKHRLGKRAEWCEAKILNLEHQPRHATLQRVNKKSLFYSFSFPLCQTPSKHLFKASENRKTGRFIQVYTVMRHVSNDRWELSSLFITSKGIYIPSVRMTYQKRIYGNPFVFRNSHSCSLWMFVSVCVCVCFFSSDSRTIRFVFNFLEGRNETENQTSKPQIYITFSWIDAYTWMSELAKCNGCFSNQYRWSTCLW